PEIEVLDDKRFIDKPEYQKYLNETEINSLKDSENQSVEEKVSTVKNAEESSPLQFLIEFVPENIFLSVSTNTLMLQVIFFAIFFGVCMALLPDEKIAPLKKFIDATNEVFL